MQGIAIADNKGAASRVGETAPFVLKSCVRIT